MRFREKLEELYNIYKGETIPNLITIIRKKAPEVDLGDKVLSRYLYQIKDELDKVMTIDDVNDWIIEDDNYVFNFGGVKKVFSIELIDDIFLHYSTRGYNYTRLKIIQKFDIKPRTLSQIQRKFNLSKDCDIISPYTKSHNDPETTKTIIDNKLERVLNSGEITTQKYQEKLARRNRKNIEDIKLDLGWRDGVIADMLGEHPLVSEINVIRDSNNEIDELTIIMADIHAGGKSEKTKLSEGWNMDMLVEKLTRVAEITNMYKAARVNLVILGDLVETVSGINHPDSWKGIESGMYGANVIITTQKLLIEHLINKIVNLKSIIATGGNHDRLQASNKLADTGATDLIFYMIQERLKITKSDITVIYDPIVVSFKTKAFGIIGVHGDKGLHKRELSYITQKFAVDRDQYQFVFSAHLHSFFCKMNDDQEFGRRVTIPAIITGNDFSDITIGRASRSGIIAIKENMFNEPDMIVHNI